MVDLLKEENDLLQTMIWDADRAYQREYRTWKDLELTLRTLEKDVHQAQDELRSAKRSLQMSADHANSTLKHTLKEQREVLDEMEHLWMTISAMKWSIRNLEDQNMDLESKSDLLTKHWDEVLNMNREY